MQDRISLKAQERDLLGKKVKKLRREGFLPGHVFGHSVAGENVLVKLTDFSKTYKQTGETGLIDLKIGEEKIRPVLIREVQLDPVKGEPLHIDFYQVNLKEKVKVVVPVVLIGEQPEKVLSGEAVIIQPLNEVEVEALPTDLPENLEVDISSLQEIEDAIFLSNLKVPAGVELLAEPETMVVKLDNAVSAEAAELMEEMEQEQAAAEAAEAPAEGEAAEGEAAAEGAEGETAGGEEKSPVEGEEEKKEE